MTSGFTDFMHIQSESNTYYWLTGWLVIGQCDNCL